MPTIHPPALNPKVASEITLTTPTDFTKAVQQAATNPAFLLVATQAVANACFDIINFAVAGSALVAILVTTVFPIGAVAAWVATAVLKGTARLVNGIVNNVVDSIMINIELS